MIMATERRATLHQWSCVQTFTPFYKENRAVTGILAELCPGNRLVPAATCYYVNLGVFLSLSGPALLF